MSRLAVTIDDGTSVRDVSHAARNLRTRRAAPGGYITADMRLNLPASDFPSLSSADVVRCFDPRTGRTVWEGYVGNPGEEHRNEGQGWDLSLVGTGARAYWATRGVAYIDRTLSHWQRDAAAAMQQAAITQVGSDPVGSTAEWLVAGWPKGAVVGMTQAALRNTLLEDLGMEVATIAVTVRSGFDGFEYQNQLTWSGGGAGGGALGSAPSSTSVRYTRRAGAGSGHPPIGTRALVLRLQRTTETPNELLDDRIYSLFRDPVVTAHRLDKYGNRIDTATIPSGEYVFSHDIAADVFGRFLKGVVDPTRVTVEQPLSAPYPIDQYAPTSALSGGEVLDQLCEYEPDMLWEILSSAPGSRLLSGGFRRWPGNPRYVIDYSHQPKFPGSDLDVCNRIDVSWNDARGNPKRHTAQAAAYALDRLGIERYADPIDLDDGVGSYANAQRAGWRVLQTTIARPYAGTAVVTGTIHDLLTGQQVQPWEIEPGYRIYLREKGVAVRLTQVEYDDESQAARLTFGTPPRTPEQILARQSARTKRVGW